jgi:alginate O-acetyltransferase complex protein AlgI
MVFSSIFFILFFLPVLIIGYYLIHPKYRNLLLLIASLLFYVAGEAKYSIVLLISIFANYIFGALIALSQNKNNSQGAKFILLISIIFNIGTLIVFKYANLIVDSINPFLQWIFSYQINLAPIHLPIGISFFTFQALSYVIDVYRRETKSQFSLINFAMYIALFPQLIAGPIVRYLDIEDQIQNRKHSINHFTEGITIFIIGLAKKVLIANNVALIADHIFSLPSQEIGFSYAWIGIIAYSLQIYFDFSGYSDMAVGLGKMFGFDFVQNFNYPYISQSIQDFWRRWHISLSTWFRDYLYIPLGGNRKGERRTYINLITVFALCGLWHGASWVFLLWGLWHGAFLIIERLPYVKKLFNISPLFIKYIYTFLVVTIGWVFFRAENLTFAIQYLGSMIGLNGNISLSNLPINIYNNKTIIFLILGIIGSIPILPYIKSKLSSIKLLKNIQYPLYYSYTIIILGISILALSNNAYNPFIYFRF